MTPDDFEPWMARWGLTADGAPFVTAWRSRLIPVRQGDVAAMLKVAAGEEERFGARLMAWYDGRGAARVLAVDDEAILLERLAGPRSLAAMARGGEDAAATRILCGVLSELHAERPAPWPPTLVPLTVWFRALPPAAARHGGVLATAWEVAQGLLAAPRDERPLHGDLHHDNVLDGGPRGWLAIDPKGLVGEAAFDYAFMSCTPDLATAGAPGALRRRAEIAVAESGVGIERHLSWVLAHAALSAAWTLSSGGDAAPALEIARLATAELGLG